MQNITHFSILIALMLIAGCHDFITKPKSNDNSSNDILFIRQDGPMSEICTISPDGTNLRIITSHDMKGEDVPQGYLFAYWSPDKSRLAVVGGPRDNREYYPIWLMDMHGNLLRRLTWAGWTTVWLDQNTLLFQRRRGYFSEIYDIYSVNIHTGADTLLYSAGDSTHLFIDDKFNDEWMLGNRRISYTDSSGKLSTTPGNIVKVNITTGEIDNLTRNSANEFGAQLSPDGRHLVFVGYSKDGVTYRYGIGNIYLLDLVSGERTQLTHNTQSLQSLYISVHWGPKGEYIVFPSYTSAYPGYYDIYTLNVNTGAVDTVTHSAKDSVSNFVMEWR